jgi:hypothetical protein
MSNMDSTFHPSVFSSAGQLEQHGLTSEKQSGALPLELISCAHSNCQEGLIRMSIPGIDDQSIGELIMPTLTTIVDQNPGESEKEKRG